MQLDASSFLIGLVVGAMVAFLLRLHVLKKLDVKLDQIGVSLGVEGFEEKLPPAGVSISGISGNISGDLTVRDKITHSTTGDVTTNINGAVRGGNEVAGRDINKTSHFYQTLQAAARDAVRGKNETPIVQATIRFRSESKDSELISRLNAISRKSNDWMEEYVNTYIASPEIKDQIQQKINELQTGGWTVQAIRSNDNIINGLLFDLLVERPL